MSQNVHQLLRRWWEEQHVIARQSGSVIGAIAMDGAEARMLVISSLMPLVNASLTVDDTQEKALWAGICSVAALKKPDRKPRVWMSRLREKPLRTLAATLRTRKNN